MLFSFFFVNFRSKPQTVVPILYYAASLDFSGEAAHYAVTFTDNRIQRTMLLDLNKEYLNDMGITMMGDVISILKHAKVISAQVVISAPLCKTSFVSVADLKTITPSFFSK